MCIRDRLVDDQNVFSLNYSKLDYDQKSTVNQTRENRFHRLNLGSFTKLYKLKTFSNSTIINSGISGVLNFTPGYHKVEIVNRDKFLLGTGCLLQIRL